MELEQHLDEREIIEPFVGQLVRDLHAPEQTERKDEALTGQLLEGRPVVSERQIAEFERVLEDFEKAGNRVLLIVEGGHIDHERIAGESLPVFTQTGLVEGCAMEHDHMDVRMPEAGILTALELVGTDRALDLGQLNEGATIREEVAPGMLHPAEGSSQMAVPLGQVFAVLDREGHKGGLQAFLLGLDDRKTVEVGLDLLRSSADRAEGADEVLLAEASRMQANLAHGEVVTEQHVVAALFHVGG